MRQHDSIIVMVERLRKVTHFILVKTTYSSSEVAQVFIREIMRLHSVSKKIVSDRDVKFTSKFWKELFEGLGTDLALSIAFHPYTYGNIERVNRILEDMLRMYMIH